MRFLIIRKGDEDRPYETLDDVELKTIDEMYLFVKGMGGKAKIITDTYDDNGCKGLPAICEIREEG